MLDALRMALCTSEPGAEVALVAHTDAGSRNTPRSTTPRRSTITTSSASIGTVGDAYDNAIAESFVDSFKTELIADRVWPTRSQLELAIVEYVAWFNNSRLHEALDDRPPREIEELYAVKSRTPTATTRARKPTNHALRQNRSGSVRTARVAERGVLIWDQAASRSARTSIIESRWVVVHNGRCVRLVRLAHFADRGHYLATRGHRHPKAGLGERLCGLLLLVGLVWHRTWSLGTRTAGLNPVYVVQVPLASLSRHWSQSCPTGRVVVAP